MSAIVTAQANQILNMSLGVGSGFTAFSGSANIYLGGGTCNGTTALTQLASGSGYTTNGVTLIFNSAASGSTTGPTVAKSWTNAGSTWSISYLEIWDSAATPIRWWYGTFNGAPISVVSGNIFQIAIGAITVTLS